jgi:hypothetical protein
MERQVPMGRSWAGKKQRHLRVRKSVDRGQKSGRSIVGTGLQKGCRGNRLRDKVIGRRGTKDCPRVRLLEPRGGRGVSARKVRCGYNWFAGSWFWEGRALSPRGWSTRGQAGGG